MSILDLQQDHTLRQLDALMKAHGEVFMMKSEFDEAIRGHRWVVVVTNKNLHKFVVGSVLTQPHTSIALLDMHCVELDPSEPRAFFVYTYKYKNRLRFHKMRGAMGLGMNFDSILQRRQYVASSVQECQQWFFVMNRLLRDTWQRITEELFIPRPEVYQRHTFVIKLNRKSKAQDRVLLLSTRWVYNLAVSHAPTVIDHKSNKWALPIACLSSLTLLGDTQLVINFNDSVAQSMLDDEHLGAKGSKVNEQHVFMFRSFRERQVTVSELVRLFELQPDAKNQLQIKYKGQLIQPSELEEVKQQDHESPSPRSPPSPQSASPSQSPRGTFTRTTTRNLKSWDSRSDLFT